MRKSLSVVAVVLASVIASSAFAASTVPPMDHPFETSYFKKKGTPKKDAMSDVAAFPKKKGFKRAPVELV